jgi:hypothetical protein
MRGTSAATIVLLASCCSWNSPLSWPSALSDLVRRKQVRSCLHQSPNRIFPRNKFPEPRRSRTEKGSTQILFNACWKVLWKRCFRDTSGPQLGANASRKDLSTHGDVFVHLRKGVFCLSWILVAIHRCVWCLQCELAKLSLIGELEHGTDRSQPANERLLTRTSCACDSKIGCVWCA